MINPNKLDLIVCYLCRERFGEYELIYAVTAEQYETYESAFKPIRKRIVTKDYTLDIKRVVRFHEKCWLKIAGKKYAP